MPAWRRPRSIEYLSSGACPARPVLRALLARRSRSRQVLPAARRHVLLQSAQSTRNENYPATAPPLKDRTLDPKRRVGPARPCAAFQPPRTPPAAHVLAECPAPFAKTKATPTCSATRWKGPPRRAACCSIHKKLHPPRKDARKPGSSARFCSPSAAGVQSRLRYFPPPPLLLRRYSCPLEVRR